MKSQKPNTKNEQPPSGANDLADVLESIRSIWSAADKAEPPVRDWVTKKITEGIERLRQQVDGKLRLAAIVVPKQQPIVAPVVAPKQQPIVAPQQQTLFQPASEVEPPRPKREAIKVPAPPPSEDPRFPEPELRVCTKDLATHALQQLPNLLQCHSVDELRNHLIANLRFNSEATRRRSANYLISRFFPSRASFTDLPQFAAATAGTPALGEALFYLTCRAEKVIGMVAEEIVFPSLALRGVARTKIRDFVQLQFPNSKSAAEVGNAVMNTYHAFGIGTATRTRLEVSLREGSLASFAYVLHLEFPEPGMYSFERLFDGPPHKWLLWDQQWMIKQLYRLREAGLLSKVSEIDRMRQFTTKYTLAEAVQPIVALAKESSP